MVSSYEGEGFEGAAVALEGVDTSDVAIDAIRQAADRAKLVAPALLAAEPNTTAHGDASMALLSTVGELSDACVDKAP